MRTGLGWAPEIPDHWSIVPLNYVAKMGTGHTPDRGKAEYWENCTIPWVTIRDATAAPESLVPLADTKQKLSELGLANSAAVVHPAGTVMLSRTASVGYSVMVDKPMATSQDFAAWSPGPRLNPRFLLLVLRAMKPEWDRLAFGSTHRTIYMPDLEALRIPLPPMIEQVKIADHLFSVVPEIELMRDIRVRQVEVLGELSQRVIDDLLGQVKAVTVRLGYLADVRSGVTVDANRARAADSVVLPYLRVANVQAGHLNLSTVAEIAVPRAVAMDGRLRVGDVLMTEGGDLDKLGRGAVWNGEIHACLHQNHVFAVRPDPGKLRSDYLSLTTRASMARQYFESTGTQTTNLASTSSGKIRDYTIPLPSLVDQAEFVADVECRLAQIATLKEGLVRQLTLLVDRRQALTAAVVTGQIDVSMASGVAV